MKVITYGINEDHQINEYSLRMSYDFFGIFHFHTPYSYEKDGKMFYGNADDILISPPNTIIYHGPINETSSFTNDWIYIATKDPHYFEQFKLPMMSPFPGNSSKTIHNALQKVDLELQTQQPGYKERIDCLLKILIIDLYREYNLVTSPNSSLKRLTDAKAQILSELDKKWTLLDMANITGYSQSRFSELYKKYFGVSPKSDLNKSRIDYAKRILLVTDAPISEIGRKCGFDDPFFFSKFFSDSTGVSPSAYRKSHQNILK